MCCTSGKALPNGESKKTCNCRENIALPGGLIQVFVARPTSAKNKNLHLATIRYTKILSFIFGKTLYTVLKKFKDLFSKNNHKKARTYFYRHYFVIQLKFLQKVMAFEIKDLFAKVDKHKE